MITANNVGKIGRRYGVVYPVGAQSARHVMFFFFQAEDGIRDLTVTGVQTCALPISIVSPGSAKPSLSASLLAGNGGVDADSDGFADPGDTIAYTLSLANSSGAGATGDRKSVV